MERRFGVQEPQISPWRRAVCGDLTSAFDFALEDTAPAPLPDTSAYEPPDRERHPSYVPKPPSKPVLPVQEAGARPTRPLPYELYVDGSATPSTGRYTLTFGAGAKAGAHFYITAPNRTDGPWTYTTGAGASLPDTWNTAYSAGTYDLTATGPQGFLRRFRGPGTKAGPEVTARHDGVGGNLVLTMKNPGAAGVTLTVTNAPAYGGQSRTFSVAQGATVTHTVDLSGSGRWYDLSVVSSGDSTFLRRFAGHVETGAPGVSDPGIITG